MVLYEKFLKYQYSEMWPFVKENHGGPIDAVAEFLGVFNFSTMIIDDGMYTDGTYNNWRFGSPLGYNKTDGLDLLSNIMKTDGRWLL